MPRFGPEGNARLTATAGLILLVLSGAELLTLLLGLQRFLSWHVFIGLVLLPPIALKLTTTGWRFLRYYTRDAAYVRSGPPMILMRLLAPFLVLFTVLLFASGVAMGFTHGTPLHLARRVHGPAALLWSITLGIHVLAYLPRAFRHVSRRAVPVAATLAALAAGVVVAVAALPAMHDWTRLHNGFDDQRGSQISGR
ncbi:MAG: hypothetical protein ABUS54_01270 [Actinomycetota bacterium]